jgi:hypothetical protein
MHQTNKHEASYPDIAMVCLPIAPDGKAFFMGGIGI